MKASMINNYCSENSKTCLKHYFEQVYFGLTFAFAIFLLCCLFELFLTGESILECFEHPSLFITRYFEKISIALFLSAFSFLIKNKIYDIVVLLVLTLWIFAELIYSQFFGGMLIDGYSIKIADNMAGFASSILTVLHWKYLWLLVPLLLFFLPKKNQIRCYKNFILFVALSFLLHLSYSLYVNTFWKKDVAYRIPFTTAVNPLFSGQYDTASQEFSTTYSVIHSLGRAIIEIINDNIPNVDIAKLNNEIKDFHLVSTISKPIPKSKLIIILIESLESWTVRPDITPNIHKFLKHDKILWAPYVKKQTKRGQSADGQMIINTGLLPLYEGAVCYRFSHNKYPSLSELFSSTLILVPGGLSVWNQQQMCKAYNINNSIETSFDDSDIFSAYQKVMHRFDYALVLTASSHTPFTKFAEQALIKLPVDMPSTMSNYLKSINYMDKCLGKLLSNVDNDSLLLNSTIVITGDHTILNSDQRTEYSKYSRESVDCNFSVEEEYCPLIIYSPYLKEKKIINNEVFQMDIYPTVLSILGCENYFWKGFGINLLGQDNRVLSEDKAFKISEEIIYSDYFNSLK